MFPAPTRRYELLLHTKLTPPQLHSRVLARPGLALLLRESLSYRLTVVHAGTGYSKTTALAALDTGESPLFWYSLGDTDSDPQRFLSYLISAFAVRLPSLSDLPLAVLQERSSEGSMATWKQALDALINSLLTVLEEPSLLVLDDYHFVAGSSEINSLVEHLLDYLPARLHVIISTRHIPPFGRMVAWRAHGEVLDINRVTLGFNAEEIESLFRDVYGMQLGPDECAALLEKTEGWPIALQLAWQGLRNSATRSASKYTGPLQGWRSSPRVLSLRRKDEGAVSSRSVRTQRVPAHVAHPGAAPYPAHANRDITSILLEQGSTSLTALFDYLASDVLGAQPPDIAAFLRDTAILRELTPTACDAVTGRTASGTMLDRLLELDLFVVALGDGSQHHYRYHHLFHDFLRQQADGDPIAARLLHERAASYFASTGDYEEAIYHWLRTGELQKVASAIEQAGDAALRAGWFDTISAWIDVLPPDVLESHPLLHAYLGDIYRMRSRFDEALGWYRQAERVWRLRNDPAGISRALRGQALVYLDTVRPAQAESLLEEALRLIEGIDDRESRARLFELLAENKLNMGKPTEAESLSTEARALREEGPGEDALSVRVKLRTGRLDEAQSTLERWAEAERREVALGQVHPPRSHRETLLMLSLIQAFRGQAERAFELAQEGIALGSLLNSPFVTAVGHVRLGHASQLRGAGEARRVLSLRRKGPEPAKDGLTRNNPQLEDAIACYKRGVALGDQLSVKRMRAEAMWGLTRAYGYSGDLASAEKAAEEGIEIGRWAGDAWIVALIELALGSSYVLAGQPDRALDTLSQVLMSFRECGDSFGRAATRLWLALAYSDLGQGELCNASLDDALALCEAQGYGFLFTSPNLLGPPDVRRLVPLLVRARRTIVRGPEWPFPKGPRTPLIDRRMTTHYALRTAHYATRLLGEIGLPDIQVHPGYRLYVYSLGTFRVFRGDIEVEPKDWQRDKARQLFQLLLTERGHRLQREEIVERLWPDLPLEAALRDFKVALNALNRALEPGHLRMRNAECGIRNKDVSGPRRDPVHSPFPIPYSAFGRGPSADAPFAFVVRDGLSYCLRPEADLWLDAEQFEENCQAGLRLDERPRTKDQRPRTKDDGSPSAHRRVPSVRGKNEGSEIDDRDEAIRRLRSALDLYGGHYLPDALYDDWASGERERLLSLFLRAADKLAGLLVESERFAEALDICSRILSYDPCWERAYRWTMLAYARQGDRALALRTYQRCAATLKAELGVEPAPATVGLYSSILQSEELPITIG